MIDLGKNQHRKLNWVQEKFDGEQDFYIALKHLPTDFYLLQGQKIVPISQRNRTLKLISLRRGTQISCAIWV